MGRSESIQRWQTFLFTFKGYSVKLAIEKGRDIQIRERWRGK
jgi:hypothetical protein